MSDCLICGLPPCICRCALLGGHLEAWRGVMQHLVAAQLHASRIAAVRAMWPRSGPRFENSTLRVALATAGTAAR
jgi:hypothetical protein